MNPLSKPPVHYTTWATLDDGTVLNLGMTPGIVARQILVQIAHEGAWYNDPEHPGHLIVIPYERIKNLILKPEPAA